MITENAESRIRFIDSEAKPSKHLAEANLFVEGTNQIESTVLSVSSLLSRKFVNCKSKVSRHQVVRIVARLESCENERVETAIGELRIAGVVHSTKEWIRFNYFPGLSPKQEYDLRKDDVCDIHGDRCAYCKRESVRKKLTLDHVIPRSQGGKDAISNLVPACRDCNQSKANRTPQEWADDILGFKANPRRSWTSCFKVAATLLFVRLGF